MAASSTPTQAPPKPPPKLPKEPPPGFGIPEKRGSIAGDEKSTQLLAEAVADVLDDYKLPQAQELLNFIEFEAEGEPDWVAPQMRRWLAPGS